jgi:hypothetical protein
MALLNRKEDDARTMARKYVRYGRGKFAKNASMNGQKLTACNTSGTSSGGTSRLTVNMHPVGQRDDDSCPTPRTVPPHERGRREESQISSPIGRAHQKGAISLISRVSISLEVRSRLFSRAAASLARCTGLSSGVLLCE